MITQEPVVREEKAKLLEKFQEATRLAEEVKKLKAELDSKSGKYAFCQCCWGSVTFLHGSGSSDPYLLLTDPDATLLAEEVKKLKASRLFGDP